MKRIFLLINALAALAVAALAADAPAGQAAAPAATTATVEADKTTQAAAAVASGAVKPATRPPDFLEHMVDAILDLFDVRSGENTVTHYVIAGVLLLAAFFLRRVVTGLIFNQLKKLAARTETTLDDKLFPALEAPVATFVMVTGILAALRVLKLSEDTDRYIGNGSTVAFSLVIFWGLLRAFNALLDHAHEVAVQKQIGIAAFMPWIKKTLIVIFVIVGGLMVIQNLGYGDKIKTLVAGLGIGGLAFALAAQDTIANLFGSLVVAIDQPFKVGEAVKIGAFEGTVEDIGLRSTKLRPIGKNLIIIPNKTVAAEAVINNSRFTQRRVEQVFGITYDAKPEQMEALVAEIRGLIEREPEVDVTSVHAYFRDLNTSSLDIWIAYNTKDSDWVKHMRLRQRLNLAIMRAVYARGLSFAFPTQTMNLPQQIVERLAARESAGTKK
jgi:MscS family membrane protein